MDARERGGERAAQLAVVPAQRLRSAANAALDITNPVERRERTHSLVMFKRFVLEATEQLPATECVAVSNGECSATSVYLSFSAARAVGGVARGGGAEEREDPLAVRLALAVRGAARRASAPKELHLTDSRPSFF